MQAMGVWYPVLIVVLMIVMLYPQVRIIRRAGYSGWWFLTMFVPIVNLVMIWVFAFAKWPALDRAKQ